ncbi:MAG TPA: hypothetical protein VGO80_09575 [Solirubrobacteraceae bacterium]|jgi:hypothetical protein|nr:hypothetical protein [Solirubrobacteraceae bacterium]
MTIATGDALRTPDGRQRPSSVTSEERQRRERLGQFLRRVEPTVHGARGDDREQIRRLLGWDDASLHAFVGADVVVHTSPHASMNAFAPMFAFPWLAAVLASAGAAPARAVHLRTIVTHNNLGDLRWRPYAWWHRGRDGSVVKTSLFSRSSKTRHHVLLSKPVPEVDLGACTGIDRAAAVLGGHARNYAYFCVVYRAFVERHAGLHGSRPVIEAPIDLLNAFSLSEDGIDRWSAALSRSGLTFRTPDGEGRLVALADPCAARLAQPGARPLLCPNAINIAQSYLLGISTVIGAERMAQYVPRMTELVDRFIEHLGSSYRPPEFVSCTNRELGAALEHDVETSARLAEDGLREALPIGAADIGRRVADNLAGLMAADRARFTQSAPYV